MSTAPNLQPNFICRAENSALVIIDLQQRLGGAMPSKVLNRVIRNSTLLIQTAGLLDVPMIQTEQYPKGLGPTLPAVAESVPDTATKFEKMTFSCCGTDGFLGTLDKMQRRQIILVGMEAHVCVLQTALELQESALEVFVVEDAICSRRLENYQNALARLRQSSVAVVSTESIVFEWMGTADHKHFKSIQKLLP